jgi:uncharacterized protein (UPF0335 family)
MTMKSETVAALKVYLERVERLEDERKSLGDDVRQVYAEAKAAGFDAKGIRSMVKRRRQDPAILAEEDTILETYMHAVGMLPENPLAAAVSRMAVDTLARDQVIEALQAMVPVNGEIIARVGGAPMRIWRDEAGQAYSAEHAEPKRAPAEKLGHGLRRSATVLSIVPADPVKLAGDKAETRAKKPKPSDEKNPAGSGAETDEPVT